MSGSRRLFCEISPLTYKISVMKCCFVRSIKNLRDRKIIAREKSQQHLKYSIYKHSALIRRRLGNVDMRLQDNKAVNLSISAPTVSGVLIKPGQIFSFWQLVGNCTRRRGYKEGLTIQNGDPNSGIGGGMCQFSNLIHWMVLHTPLIIVEHHHHDGYDLFPDNGRQLPFGSGTSIMYNYLDYRFRNDTDMTFQLVVHTDNEYLHGEILADKPLSVKYHIKAVNGNFSRENGIVYRNNEIYRECVDKATGTQESYELLKKNHAKVMYDTADLEIIEQEVIT